MSGVRDRRQLLDRVERGERGTAVHHLVQDTAEGPDVRGASEPHLVLGVARVTHGGDGFGSHVVDLNTNTESEFITAKSGST
jgi:hypothetical protein